MASPAATLWPVKLGALPILLAAAVLAAACSAAAPASGARPGALPASPTGSASPPGTASTAPAATAAATPVPTTGTGVTGAGAADPVAAVRALLPSPGAATACRPASGALFSGAAGCPVTQRLEQRLRSSPTGGSGAGADPVCRCQNLPATVTVTLETPGGTSALVRASFGFSGSPYDVRFVVVSQGGRWFVDDSYCADPSSSIYASPVRACA